MVAPSLPAIDEIPTFEVTVLYEFERDWYHAHTTHAYTDYYGGGPTWEEAFANLLVVLRRHWPAVRRRNLVFLK